MKYFFFLLLVAAVSICNAQDIARPKPEIEPDGTVHVPAYRLPPSAYMSTESKKALPREAWDEDHKIEELIAKGGVPKLRQDIIKDMQAQIKTMYEKYPVRTQDTLIGGIHVIRIVPVKGIAAGNRNKVLINLHSGGFLVGSPWSMGLVESVPLAVLAGIEIITIQYRQAPEAVFPAACMDVSSVYKALLKTYQPKNIGVYGCSSGGLLTAQSMAWLQKERLPLPGAIGILCASADARWGGDSWNWQRPLLGMSGPPSLDERFYYGQHNLDDSLMSPIKSSALLKKFPPTLFITSTRSPELSSAINTHRELVKVNVDARLHVWDGMWHVFFTNLDLPESNEAFDVLAAFFKEKLKCKK